MAKLTKKRAVESLSNADLAELLANRGGEVPPPLNKAFRRAARKAFLWPEEASDLHRAQRQLTELSGVGPFIAKELRKWIEKPP